VELFSVVSDSRKDFDVPPPGFEPERYARVGIDDATPGSLRFAAALLRPDLPFELPRHCRRQVSQALARFALGPYDLVWFFRVRAWVLSGGRLPDPAPPTTPAVVDLDDLEDQKIRARLSIPRPGSDGVGAMVRRRASTVLWAEEVRRWQSLHRRIARRSAASVVCSALDAQRVRLPRTRVVPNGYPEPPRVVDHRHPHSPPVVLFQGTLRYPPNADGARFLCRDVAPLLRRRVAAVRIRLVGLAPPSLSDLDDRPRVTVAGQVPDITDELAGADLVVVPLRFGSGTRVKIIEAFAHGVPVVSTTLGAEGLEVRDGVHLLLADTAEELAGACARLLDDATLRAALIASGRRCFEEHYGAAQADDAVRQVAESVAGAMA
jgi:glycosyltransferase involved in cell wall biosynthesis